MVDFVVAVAVNVKGVAVEEVVIVVRAFEPPEDGMLVVVAVVLVVVGAAVVVVSWRRGSRRRGGNGAAGAWPGGRVGACARDCHSDAEPRCGGGCVWVAGAVAGGFASVAGASVAGAPGVGGAGVLGVGGLWLWKGCLVTVATGSWWPVDCAVRLWAACRVVE